MKESKRDLMNYYRYILDNDELDIDQVVRMLRAFAESSKHAQRLLELIEILEAPPWWKRFKLPRVNWRVALVLAMAGAGVIYGITI